MGVIIDNINKNPMITLALFVITYLIAKCISAVLIHFCNVFLAIVYLILSIWFNLPMIRLKGMILYANNPRPEQEQEVKAQEQSMDQELREESTIKELSKLRKVITLPERRVRK